MKSEIYKCDGCGKVKGEVNHWYTAIILKMRVDVGIRRREEFVATLKRLLGARAETPSQKD